MGRIVSKVRQDEGVREMIVWTPIAVNEKPLPRGKAVLPVYSAATIGNSVVLRL
jgi:hypothetical protein